MKTQEYVPTNYPSDLTDKEWEIIEALIPVGNKSGWHKRSLVNAVFYVEKTGCQWRFLPRDYPPYSTVWSFFRRARDSGLWERIKDTLVKETRKKAGRKESPTYAIIDSQSVKTVSASEERGIDGGKKS
jgi:putative transposase